jgi:hypothetical protein
MLQELDEQFSSVPPDALWEGGHALPPSSQLQAITNNNR